MRKNACRVSGGGEVVARSRRDYVGTGPGQSRKSVKCGVTEWRDFKASIRAFQQSAYSVSRRCAAVARSRRDNVGTGSGQSRKSVKCGVTEWRDFKASIRSFQQSACSVSGRCEAVAQSRRDHVGTGSGQSRKVTNAARPSGGTSKLAFVHSNRVHTVCLDDARRQWRGHDATVWGLDRVKVEK
jgi:hypothetical protein